MKRKILLLLFVVLLGFPGSLTTPEAEAFDPITVALLAPVMIKAYEICEPRITKGFKFGGKQMVEIGTDMLEILYLPLGCIQCTLGAPFGFMKSGVKHLVKGFVAPFKMVVHVLVLPFTMWGLDL